MDGSSATGNCSSVTIASFSWLSRCDAPTSSVLFDNNVPTLTGNMFASQLLTLQLMQNTISTHRELIFDFTGTSTSFRVERVELVMFNCPERGIAVQDIRLHTAPSIIDDRIEVQTFPVPNITSCDSLVRICITESIVQPVISLQFFLPVRSTLTYLAEVTFYRSGSCPPDTIITASPQDTTSPPLLLTTPTIQTTTSHIMKDSKHAWMHALQPAY